jgi:hypothetical protein
MSFKYNSSDKKIQVKIAGGKNVVLKPIDSLAGESEGRVVSVSLASNARSVSISLKPAVIAREARQERLNSIIRHGFTPITRSTKG